MSRCVHEIFHSTIQILDPSKEKFALNSFQVFYKSSRPAMLFLSGVFTPV